MDFILLIIIAILTEAFLERLKAVFPVLVDMDKKYKKVAIFALLGSVVGIVLALFSNANIFAMIGIEFNEVHIAVGLTGVIAGSGTKFVHDLINKIRENKLEE